MTVKTFEVTIAIPEDTIDVDAYEVIDMLKSNDSLHNYAFEAKTIAITKEVNNAGRNG